MKIWKFLLGRNQADCWKHWNKLKRLGNNKSNRPDLITFHEYFKQQSNPPSCDYFDKDNMETIITSLQSTPYECNNDIASQICDLVITEGGSGLTL